MVDSLLASGEFRTQAKGRSSGSRIVLAPRLPGILRSQWLAHAALVPGYSDGLAPDSHRLPDTFRDSYVAISTRRPTESQANGAVDTRARRVIPMRILGVRVADLRGKAVKIGRGPATVMGESDRRCHSGARPGEGSIPAPDP